ATVSAPGDGADLLGRLIVALDGQPEAAAREEVVEPVVDAGHLVLCVYPISIDVQRAVSGTFHIPDSVTNLGQSVVQGVDGFRVFSVEVHRGVSIVEVLLGVLDHLIDSLGHLQVTNGHLRHQLVDESQTTGVTTLEGLHTEALPDDRVVGQQVSATLLPQVHPAAHLLVGRVPQAGHQASTLTAHGSQVTDHLGRYTSTELQQVRGPLQLRLTHVVHAREVLVEVVHTVVDESGEGCVTLIQAIVHLLEACGPGIQRINETGHGLSELTHREPDASDSFLKNRRRRGCLDGSII